MAQMYTDTKQRRVTPIGLSGLLIALCGLCDALPLAAEDKKPDDKKPQLLVAVPLVVSPGALAKLTLRGRRIDEASEIRATVGDVKVETKLVAKQKGDGGDGQGGGRSGDSQVEIELNLPGDAQGAVKFVAVTPAGESEPYELPLLAAEQIEQEREPNDGLDGQSTGTEVASRSAQPLSLGKVLVGRIERGQDVDVFSFDAPAGQPLVIEINARRLGSPLDPILTLFDARGSILASSDDILPSGNDMGGSVDARIEHTSPGGALFVAVMDAHDQGSPNHGYQLTIRQR